jgi:hypothetical protein
LSGSTYDAGARLSIWTYGCCGLESHTDRSGTITTYIRQDGKLLVEATITL